jgi:hypothetical protein
MKKVFKNEEKKKEGEKKGSDNYLMKPESDSNQNEVKGSDE